MEGLRERDGKLAMIVSKGYVRWLPARRSTNLQPSLSRQAYTQLQNNMKKYKKTRNQQGETPGEGGGGGYSPNMVNGGVPLKWVTFFKNIPKHGVGGSICRKNP